MLEDYEKALKGAKKDYQRHVSNGEYPYLPALEDIVSVADIAYEDNIGLVQIPAHLIVGTAYMGRTNSFASNFLPLLDKDTEFAKKWILLCNAHVEEGIRDPIKVYEYMNRFYVVEGNKRVSVLKYFGAASVLANVTRKVPIKTNELENMIYYEFMDFYELTRIYRIIFSKLGSYQKLMELLPVEPGKKWDDDFRQDFLSVYYRFESAYEKSKVKKLDLTTSDIFLIVLENFGYEGLVDLSSDEMLERMKSLHEEILLEEVHDIQIAMDPDEPSHKNFFDKMFSSPVSNLKVAFVNNKSVDQSGWVYGHELGRMHLENVFGDKVSTERFEITSSTMELDSEAATEEMTASLEEIIGMGYKVIFTTTPELVEVALKVSLAHPDVIILNCSLNVPHKYVRTYYGRMYEAKFIMGAIAAAYSESNEIGYVADYPIYGMTANINAFALGAKMINPRSMVYLEWETLKDPVESSIFDRKEITLVSNRDMIAPSNKSRQFGLCKNEKDKIVNLAMPIWNWGVFYERIVRSILNGDYKKNADVALNYWWGMNVDAIDIFCSHHLPTATRNLAEFLKKSIKNEILNPFCGKIVAQDGRVYCENDACLMPEQLMKMEWLVENVVGSIPTIDELRDDIKPVVRLQGVLGVIGKEI
ncbi:MAG: BMP family ABC transporter substrate-binding protein [Lachnospiraceae bacterium]